MECVDHVIILSHVTMVNRSCDCDHNQSKSSNKSPDVSQPIRLFVYYGNVLVTMATIQNEAHACKCLISQPISSWEGTFCTWHHGNPNHLILSSQSEWTTALQHFEQPIRSQNYTALAVFCGYIRISNQSEWSEFLWEWDRQDEQSWREKTSCVPNLW